MDGIQLVGGDQFFNDLVEFVLHFGKAGIIVVFFAVLEHPVGMLVKVMGFGKGQGVQVERGTVGVEPCVELHSPFMGFPDHPSEWFFKTVGCVSLLAR